MATRADLSPRKLVRIVQSFRTRRMVVVGDLMLDRYIWGKAGRLSPEAPVPVVDFLKEESVSGGAGNVAANLAVLGAKSAPFGVVGADAFAPALVARLRKDRLGVGGVVTDAARPTTVKTRIIAGHQQVVRVDQEAREPLAPGVEEKLIRRIISGLRSAHALVLSDYDKGVVTEELSNRILAACQRLRVPAYVKPRWSREFLYPGATAIVLNRAEAGSLVRTALDSSALLEDAGRKLLAHFNCQIVVITRGDQGMSVFEQDAPRGFHIAATSRDTPHGHLGQRGHSGRQVFDVTGAGDTVLATLALAAASGASPHEAAVLANAAAGVVVAKLGTATLTREELVAALRNLS